MINAKGGQFEKLKRFAPRPLLMINGDVDTDSPKVYSVDLYRELLPLYQEHSELLRFSIYDGIAHRVTGKMIEEVCHWFYDYLMKPLT